VALVTLFWRASDATGARARARTRALRLLAGARRSGSSGRSLALVPRLAAQRSRTILADLFLVASYPLTLAAFLAFPMGARTTDRWKLAARRGDGRVRRGRGALVSSCCRETPPAAIASPLGVALALVYPLADLLILVTIVTVLLRRPIEDHRRRSRGWPSARRFGVIDDLFRSLLLRAGRVRSPRVGRRAALRRRHRARRERGALLRAPRDADRRAARRSAGRFISALPSSPPERAMRCCSPSRCAAGCRR
jgi:hypothetical protein